MPPWAATEWLRTGWTLEMTATSRSGGDASAALIPARPAPTMTMSCIFTAKSRLVCYQEPTSREPSPTARIDAKLILDFLWRRQGEIADLVLGEGRANVVLFGSQRICHIASWLASA
jgi:hypothetical protein